MVLLADRRRVNGPIGSTSDPEIHTIKDSSCQHVKRRTRLPGELRKIFMKTGLVPSASGSAYLELSSSRSSSDPSKSGLKLACTVHGPRPLPRSAPFTPHLLVSTRVKFAPFASRERKGYIPDSVERDLASHLESALKAVLLTERWPKSGLDVVITVLESDEDTESTHKTTTGMMNTLSGCVNVASAAVADAGVDCVDVLTMGVAAYIRQQNGELCLVLDPCASDSEPPTAVCAVGYLQSRDEVTFLWAMKQDAQDPDQAAKMDYLIENGIEAASCTRSVVIDSLQTRLNRT